MGSNPFDEKTQIMRTETSVDSKTQVVGGEVTATVDGLEPESSVADSKVSRKIRTRDAGLKSWMWPGVLIVMVIATLWLLSQRKRARDVVAVPAVVQQAAAPEPELVPGTAVRRMNKGDLFQLLKSDLAKNRGPASTGSGF